MVNSGDALTVPVPSCLMWHLILFVRVSSHHASDNTLLQFSGSLPKGCCTIQHCNGCPVPCCHEWSQPKTHMKLLIRCAFRCASPDGVFVAFSVFKVFCHCFCALALCSVSCCNALSLLFFSSGCSGTTTQNSHHFLYSFIWEKKLPLREEKVATFSHMACGRNLLFKK